MNDKICVGSHFPRLITHSQIGERKSISDCFHFSKQSFLAGNLFMTQFTLHITSM